MKFPRIATVFLSIAFILGAEAEKCSAISSPVLLTIDDSNPSAVLFTATVFPPGVNDNSKPMSSGVDLLAFFSASQSTLFGQFLPNSTLSGGNSGASYNNVRGDNFSTSGGSSLDLRLLLDASSSGAANLQTFSTLQQAFTGSWTVNLSSLGVSPSALPTVGATGNILSGFGGDRGVVIGEWEIAAVPEPSVGSLVVLASVLGAVVRRRRAA